MKRFMFVSMGIVAIVAAVAVAPANAELVAQLKFDETTGATAADSSGKGNTGTLRFGPTWATGGKSGEAIAFDGLNDYVSVADNAALKYTGGNLTLSAWVNINETETDGGYIFSKAMDGTVGAYNYRIGITPDKKVSLMVGDASAWFEPQVTSSNALSTGTWHHIVGVLDSSKNMKLYVDGGDNVFSGTHSLTTWPNGTDNNLPLTIGSIYPYYECGDTSWGGSSVVGLDGKVDDVQIYSDALNAEQVSYLYAHPGVAIPEPTSMALLFSGVLGLLAYAWRKRK